MDNFRRRMGGKGKPVSTTPIALIDYSTLSNFTIDDRGYSTWYYYLIPINLWYERLYEFGDKLSDNSAITATVYGKFAYIYTYADGTEEIEIQSGFEQPVEMVICMYLYVELCWYAVDGNPENNKLSINGYPHIIAYKGRGSTWISAERLLLRNPDYYIHLYSFSGTGPFVSTSAYMAELTYTDYNFLEHTVYNIPVYDQSNNLHNLTGTIERYPYATDGYKLYVK